MNSVINAEASYTKEVVKKWKEKFEEGVLSRSHVEDYWRTWVPRLYSPPLNDNCWHFNFNEEEVTRILLRPLEEFICDGDPTIVLHELLMNEKKPSMCCKVFKHGQPGYRCKQCGMDNTSVLCVDCFKKSKHKDHKYKIIPVGGGGCCDCGTTEYSKEDLYCEVHNLGLRQEQSKLKLPESLMERTRIIFDAVLWYAYDVLTSENLTDEDRILNDEYCTILYNDPSYTFELISTLKRVLNCSEPITLDYMFNISRKGRGMIKCSDFQRCSDLKSEIEKDTSIHGNKPLKVLVVHAHVLAQQIFAMKLLSWLQGFLGRGESFRAIFTEIALKPQQSDPCIIIKLLLRYPQLWKDARTEWYTLIISGMFLEYENKKAFAKIFTEHYGNVMENVIAVESGSTFSIASLSLQIFSTPTLAHHLIASGDVLSILLNTFLSECFKRCNKNGKLEFETNGCNQTFNRAQYLLDDLRYLLSFTPQVWTDNLKENFLRSLSLLLKLLTMMQGMDSATRQIGQYVGYEPEWATAFNLHITLTYCIWLVLEWCGSNRDVLIKAYRLTLEQLHDYQLTDKTITCLEYDVSLNPVSVHLPLSRFLAGLHLHLPKYNLSFDEAKLKMDKPTPLEIIEPVLRTQVMIAQVRAGMWHRNGCSLLNQLHYYHNVKCRSEMLDRDVILLQIGATLIESNDFITHLLNKYNLFEWASPNFVHSKLNEDDTIQQTMILAEEFLQLLIMIIGERFIPGISDVSQEERIKKEIIQHLCIKPLQHSQLYAILPEVLCPNGTEIDDVIDDIATFKKPTQGKEEDVYELKDAFFEDYNIFFYHYTPEELSVSEDAQRRRRKAKGELECCPPPELPKLSEAFTSIVNLLQSDVMLHIMQIVLERSANSTAISSQLQLHKVLHLIGYALQEEQTGYYSFLKFSEKSIKFNLQCLLETLSKKPEVKAHRDLIKWTLNLYEQMGENVKSLTINCFNGINYILENIQFR